MMEFYFAGFIYQVGGLSSIEREIKIECDRYLNRIVTSDQLMEMLEDFREISEKMNRKNPRLVPAVVSMKKNPEDAEIRFGKNVFVFYLVKGSGKDAAASEKFNDGWWNCFESFVQQLTEMRDPKLIREISTSVLNDAGVTSSEAFMRVDTTLSDQTAKDVTEYYANLKFID